MEIGALSALILFIEMLLVRWIGTELRVFAYLQNGVLVATFLGLGLGCGRADGPVKLLPAAGALVLIGLVIRDPLGYRIGEALTTGLVAFQDSVVWAASLERLPRYLLQPVRSGMIAFALCGTLALLYSVARVLYPFGQWLGARMAAHPRPLLAYSANLLGSLAGIAAFDLLTVLWAPPWLWLLPVAGALAVLATRADDDRWARGLGVALSLLLPLLGTAGGRTAVTIWSPYQKITMYGAETASCAKEIRVNGATHQMMVNLDRDHMRALPGKYPPEHIRTSHYVLPYELVGPRRDVLVVGAGSGNDVAAALAAGADSVRAVEIDPAIASLGRSRHPNRPYDSPRVSLVVEDARAHFHRDPARYDLIWFGLLDSHTTPSAYTNVRLDHFVYTLESLAEASRLLKPTGVMVVLFVAEKPWIADRLARLMRDTFDADPITAQVPGHLCLGLGGTLLIGGTAAALTPIRERAAGDRELATTLRSAEDFPLKAEPTTDDWPYLYLEHPSVPTYHLAVGALCLLLGLTMFGRSLGSWRTRIDPLMGLLGMGFMLLEVSAVSRAALLFGTTWLVTAYVVGAVLTLALLANLWAARRPPELLAWGGLVVSLLGLLFVPTRWLATLPTLARVAAGAPMLALPVLFSGLIFSSRWSTRARRDVALSSNMLGALLGGLASMLSMLFGFQSLTLMTLAVYLGALLLALREAGRRRG